MMIWYDDDLWFDEDFVLLICRMGELDGICIPFWSPVWTICAPESSTCVNGWERDPPRPCMWKFGSVSSRETEPPHLQVPQFVCVWLLEDSGANVDVVNGGGNLHRRSHLAHLTPFQDFFKIYFKILASFSWCYFLVKTKWHLLCHWFWWECVGYLYKSNSLFPRVLCRVALLLV